ncbi:GNAT family N-acetyltransferase [Brachybacterium sp. AOP25-B2-12]|uniref:GNAT family N-acetyltransferase n=1 Tax=Brachybacterium sp. AOP25-B2-12 TaxID=3457710 RepID=UPI0040345051
MSSQERQATPSANAVRAQDAPEVTLRVISARDARVLSSIETRDRRYLEAGAPRRSDDWVSVRGQRQVIAQAIGDLRADRAVPLVIEAGGELVGRIGLNAVVRGAFQSASLGYWVRQDRAGQGIATQAVRQVADLAFGAIGLHRLQAEVQVGNDASVRVLERCGFTEYGLARRYLRLGGAWRDCRLFQLLDPEWEERHVEDAGVGEGAQPAVVGGSEAVTSAVAGGRADDEVPDDGSADGEFEADGSGNDGYGDDVLEADGTPDGGAVDGGSADDGSVGGGLLGEGHLGDGPSHETRGSVDIAVETPGADEAAVLYDEVGWSTYTRDRAVLGRALDGSAVVVTARHRGRLVGLARVVGDGAVIAYLQDVLVVPRWRRRGLGRLLVDAAFAPFAEVRQQVLLTDAEPGQRAFYEELGFTEVHDHEPGLRAFVRML